MKKYYVTSDEHYGHKNIIKYCNRSFDSIEEMNQTIIDNHNKIVTEEDTTIHVGDFTLKSKTYAIDIIHKLNGSHMFIKGSHDYWLDQKHMTRLEKKIYDNFIVFDHYAMRVWPRSHHNSILLFGHSHGGLKSFGKSMDVGVDTNNFYPYSIERVVSLMRNKPDNFNLVRR